MSLEIKRAFKPTECSCQKWLWACTSCQWFSVQILLWSCTAVFEKYHQDDHQIYLLGCKTGDTRIDFQRKGKKKVEGREEKEIHFRITKLSFKWCHLFNTDFCTVSWPAIKMWSFSPFFALYFVLQQTCCHLFVLQRFYLFFFFLNNTLIAVESLTRKYKILDLKIKNVEAFRAEIL